MRSANLMMIYRLDTQQLVYKNLFIKNWLPLKILKNYIMKVLNYHPVVNACIVKLQIYQQGLTGS